MLFRMQVSSNGTLKVSGKNNMCRPVAECAEAATTSNHCCIGKMFRAAAAVCADLPKRHTHTQTFLPPCIAAVQSLACNRADMMLYSCLHVNKAQIVS